MRQSPLSEDLDDFIFRMNLVVLVLFCLGSLFLQKAQFDLPPTSNRNSAASGGSSALFLVLLSLDLGER